MSNFLQSLTKVFTALGLGVAVISGRNVLQAQQTDRYLAERLTANRGPRQDDVARAYEHRRANNRIDLTASAAFTLLGCAIAVLGAVALKQQGRNGSKLD